MNLELVKDIYNLHIKGFEGLDFNVIRKNNYEITYNENKMCKAKNISTAYLQTEQGFYPNKMYKKFGFEDLCVVYYYLKR